MLTLGARRAGHPTTAASKVKAGVGSARISWPLPATTSHLGAALHVAGSAAKGPRAAAGHRPLLLDASHLGLVGGCPISTRPLAGILQADGQTRARFPRVAGGSPAATRCAFSEECRSGASRRRSFRDSPRAARWARDQRACAWVCDPEEGSFAPTSGRACRGRRCDKQATGRAGDPGRLAGASSWAHRRSEGTRCASDAQLLRRSVYESAHAGERDAAARLVLLDARGPPALLAPAARDRGVI